MRIFKSYPFLKLVNSYIIDAPVPSNINYLLILNFLDLVIIYLGSLIKDFLLNFYIINILQVINYYISCWDMFCKGVKNMRRLQ